MRTFTSPFAGGLTGAAGHLAGSIYRRQGCPVPEPTDRLRRRIQRDFPPGTAEEVIKRIAALPAAITGKQNPERVQAALVLAAQGQWRRFDAILRLLDQDGRDVLVAGDLADADWPTRLDAQLPDS
jgi:hypothetical protein